MAWTNGDVEMLSNARKASPGLYEAKESAQPTRAPHTVVGSDPARKNCSWTGTERGLTGRVGHPTGGQLFL